MPDATDTATTTPTFLLDGWRSGLSGTDPQSMLDAVLDARSAVYAARQALFVIDINGRDYVGREAAMQADQAARRHLALRLTAVSDALMDAAESVAASFT
jgi:hypothetical protein